MTETELKKALKNKKAFFVWDPRCCIKTSDGYQMRLLTDPSEFEPFLGTLSDITDILNRLVLPKKNKHIYKHWDRKIELVDEEKQIYRLSFVKR